MRVGPGPLWLWRSAHGALAPPRTGLAGRWAPGRPPADACSPSDLPDPRGAVRRRSWCQVGSMAAMEDSDDRRRRWPRGPAAAAGTTEGGVPAAALAAIALLVTV